MVIHGTTILAVRKDGKTAVGGDGQVTVEHTVDYTYNIWNTGEGMGIWFIPATRIASFWAFLLGVCVIAAGLTFTDQDLKALLVGAGSGAASAAASSVR